MTLSNTAVSPAVVVTGSGSGIGNAVTKALLAKGYRVFGSAISSEEATTLKNDLGSGFVPFVMDVRDEADVQAAAQRVAKELSGQPLKALLNIAGVTVNGPLVDLTASEFQNLLAVNLVGVHNATRAFLPQLRAGADARVVILSSASGRRTMPFTGAYGPSKFAIESLSTVMRYEFAPFGMHVSVIAPGPIDTPMAARIQQELAVEPSDPVYREPLQRFLHASKESFSNGVPLPKVVNAIVEAVESPKPKRRYELHQNFLRDVVIMRLLPTGRREAIIRRRLGLEPQESR